MLNEARKPAPEFPERFAPARALEGQGRIQEAVQAYRALLMTDTRDAAVWHQLGRLLMNLRHLDAAVSCYKRALEISPGEAQTHAALGISLMALDRQDEAIASYAEAVRLAPADCKILSLYAGALRECNRQEEALELYDAVLAKEPQNREVKWERALACLDLGRLAEGWANYEMRWNQAPTLGMGPERNLGKPRWTGEDFKGKTLFVYEEQGFGDTMLASRYFPLVKARGGRVVFECHKNLHRLLSAVPGIDRIVSRGAQPGAPPEDFDLQAPLMSLPAIFSTELSGIPPVVPLFASPEPPPEAKALLAQGGDRFKVGIVWSGRVDFPRNPLRAVTAARFLPFAEVPGVQLYSLQKGPPERELGVCGGRSLVWELGPHVNDFADTAAVLNSLDLVIMTDSSVAHLAGSLNKPVWNMLNFRPYWLYLKDREDCPWYPSMRLFRQPTPGNWEPVFARVTEELKKSVALKAAGKWPS